MRRESRAEADKSEDTGREAEPDGSAAGPGDTDTATTAGHGGGGDGGEGGGGGGGGGDNNDTTPPAGRMSMDDLCKHLERIGPKVIGELLGTPEQRSRFNAVTAAEEYLHDNLLKSLPFGRYLFGAATAKLLDAPGTTAKERQERGEHRAHMLYVVAGMADLLSEDGPRFLSAPSEHKQPADPAENEQPADPADQPTRPNEDNSPPRIFEKFRKSLDQAVSENGDNPHLLRLTCLTAALYHDIGKSIATERHPYEGYHILRHLGAVTDATDVVENGTHLTSSAMYDLEKWIHAATRRKRKEATKRHLDLLLQLLRHHDMWGNVTTGEASVVMLASAIGTSDRPEGALVFLGHLALLNLADQFGSYSLFDQSERDRRRQQDRDNLQDKLDNAAPRHASGDLVIPKPTYMTQSNLAMLLGQWETLRKVLRQTKGDRERTRAALLDRAGRASETIDRLCALLSAIGISISQPSEVDEILKSVCGGRYYAFCQDFSVVRLSYALRFFRGLRDVAHKTNTKLAQGSGSPEQDDQDTQDAKLVVAVLKRILDTYEPLIRANREQRRETGIEMSWLARSAQVRDSIIRTLQERDRDAALSWIDDEVSAFPCG